MTYVSKCAVATAAFLVASNMSSAATQTVSGSFVLEFDDGKSFADNETIVTFDPFAGPADSLTGVVLSVDSFISAREASTGTVFSFRHQPPGFILSAGKDLVVDDFIPVEFSFDMDLLVQPNYEPSFFVGGPVTFKAGVLDANDDILIKYSGTWYAGENPSPGGGGISGPADFGSITLTYQFDEEASIPLPASFPILFSGLIILGVLSYRQKPADIG